MPRTPGPVPPSKENVMSPCLIKICGIRDAAMADHALACGADLIGFMHFARSPRHLELVEIDALIRHIKGRGKSAVVLVNPDETTFARTSEMAPDVIQLHGQESPEWVERAVRSCPSELFKVLPVATSDDLAPIRDYQEAGIKTFLLDAKPPKGASRPGGLGRAFDWDVLNGLPAGVRFFLSGGLGLQNVAEAIARVRPVGVDVSSGVESAPGQKDPLLVKKFIANARSAMR